MKKILLSLMLILSLCLLGKLQAQCELSISDVSYEVIGGPTDLGGGKCEYIINAQFNLTYNSGSKFVYFHLFQAQDYPSASNNPDLAGPGPGQPTAFENGLFGCAFGASNNRQAPDINWDKH
jgi:hypothetical protein